MSEFCERIRVRLIVVSDERSFTVYRIDDLDVNVTVFVRLVVGRFVHVRKRNFFVSGKRSATRIKVHDHGIARGFVLFDHVVGTRGKPQCADSQQNGKNDN